MKKCLHAAGLLAFSSSRSTVNTALGLRSSHGSESQPWIFRFFGERFFSLNTVYPNDSVKQLV